MTEALPSNFEAKLILDEVRDDDRVVYLGTCACTPLARDISRKVRKSGGLVAAGRDETLSNRGASKNASFLTGTHEQVPVEDGWATLVVGECILDEFRNMERAFSQFSRILSPGGRLLASGPVDLRGSNTQEETSITSDPIGLLPLSIVKDQLGRAGFVEIEITDLSRLASKAMKRTNRFQRLGNALSVKTNPIAFIFAKAVRA